MYKQITSSPATLFDVRDIYKIIILSFSWFMCENLLNISKSIFFFVDYVAGAKLKIYRYRGIGNYRVYKNY